jgi:ribose transport system substrate-binding protein
MNREDTMKVFLAPLVAVGMIVLGADPALAAKKQLSLVLGPLDNPFFQDIANGCTKWNEAHADGDYECVAVGPAKSANAKDEVKMLTDALAAAPAALAVAPATPGLQDVLKAKAGSIPVMTIAGDFPPEDKALRKTWFAGDDYQVGVALAGMVSTLKPNGGTICFEQNNPKAININARAAGVLDTLSKVKGTTKLAGEGGWTEAKGCPLYNNDDLATATKQLSKLLKDNPKLDAVVLVGGWAMFDAGAYKKSIAKAKARLADGSLVIVSGDTLPMQIETLKAGGVQGLVGQNAFAMGMAAADLLVKLAAGDTVPDPSPAPLALCTKETAATCMAH